MHKLSICIPTYNRAPYLQNCLNSIIKNKLNSNIDFQVCVSDNCSSDETELIVKKAQQSIEIKYQRNAINLGIPRNFKIVVEMAEGDFVWLIGDDDLILPNAVQEICRLINEHPVVDFFYINSFNLSTEYVLSFPQPFDTDDLPREMKPFSNYVNSGEIGFLKLIDPKISFDFLGGMFLSVFKREKWIHNVDILNSEAITDSRTFSHFDNTFPHVKIFSKAFAKSTAYFHAEPLSVCLSGAREWAPMYPLVRSVRLIEALDEYKKNGLGFFKYLYCKNVALKNFIPDMWYIYLNKHYGYEYINPLKCFLNNCFFPNIYLSVFLYFYRKAKT